jgi:hypothetical protein
MRAKEFIIEHTVPGLDSIPPEPGTAPIPSGTVRLYHQTTEQALHSIAKHGLTLDNARGIEGPKAIYASEKGFYGSPEEVPTLEFYVDQSKWDSPFVLQDVMPDQMIAIHLPWHARARYMESDPDTMQVVLSGELDDLTGDYKQAIDYIKSKYKS